MIDEKNYLEINKQAWNKRTEHHIGSEFYDVKGFLEGKNSLNEIELDLLGDVSGKSILHLQCHFGQDSISLARLGAEVTGVDFSDKAIHNAILLAIKANVKADFICCDVYDLPNKLNKKFDIVFTSYGTIGWLPDMDKWAKVVSTFLKPGGQFVFAEFHPVVWMFDNNFEKIAYNYFKADAIIETETGTYADRNAPISHDNVSWNHGIAEVLDSLLNNKLKLKTFQEFNYSPYNCFAGMEEVEKNKYQIKNLGNKIPMVYALVAIKE